MLATARGRYGQEKPLCVDLFCGLGGWAEGFLAEGWNVIGFDIERHAYGNTCPMCNGTSVTGGISDCLVCDRSGQVQHKYPAQFVIQDVLTLHGAQFHDADCIVASPPCQEYSYMAMPWKRGKQIADVLRNGGVFPAGYIGSGTIKELNALFDACFRIQREASAAAGRHIPLVVENVKGAQPWVGRAKAHYGSFYLWGDVGNIGGRIVRSGEVRFGAPAIAAAAGSRKVSGFNFHAHEKTGQPGGSFQSAAVKNGGGSWFNIGSPGQTQVNQNPVNGVKNKDADGYERNHPNEFGWKSPRTLSGAKQARKAASAQIAKIPFPLSSHIARIYKPEDQR